MTHSSSSRPARPRATRWRLAAALPAFLYLTLLAACGGGGGGGADAPAEPPPPPVPVQPADPVRPVGPVPVPGDATVRGRVTFDYVPSAGGRLAYAHVEARPVRGARLQLVDEAGTVVADTRTDAEGRYSAQAPEGRPVRLRVSAELLAGNARTRVTDNTQGDALYALESPAFTGGGTRDLHAPSGWTGAGYRQPRSAAPFAVLDTVYRTQAALLAVDPRAALRPLDVHWSPGNRAVRGDKSQGQIGGTHFTAAAADTTAHIYVMGDEDVNTDEYDEGVIAHEWGHYYQWAFSRSDSPGGRHAGEPLELALAFSEGWGSAWSGIALGIAAISDAMGPGQASGWFLPLDRAVTKRPGAHAEDSVATVIWNFARQRGVVPVHAAMRQLAASPAFNTLYAFSHAVRGADPDAADALDVLLEGQAIVTSRSSGDAYGTGETNDGGLQVLPPYLPLAPGQSARVCSVSTYGKPNKLGNTRYLKVVTHRAGHYKLAILGRDRGDGSRPRVELSWLDGVERTYGWTDTPGLDVDLPLPAGTLVLSLADRDVLRGSYATGCFDVQLVELAEPPAASSYAAPSFTPLRAR
ncbi:carboxypeptidase-like regulatory domain-containing protein [Ramlibacter sp. MAHUQ-53]|uniref:carboxypeptidase-like regulatory domain-containing protein n=1 Tax=unclassified Ramlibacter TaxID=2617605 RepID=UPI0036267D1B